MLGLNELLVKIGFIPPLADIIVEYSKCWQCHDTKHRVLTKSETYFEYGGKNGITYGIRIFYAHEPNMYAHGVYVMTGLEIMDYLHGWPIMHIDTLAHLIAHESAHTPDVTYHA